MRMLPAGRAHVVENLFVAMRMLPAGSAHELQISLVDVGNYENVSATIRTFSHVHVSRSKTFRFRFAHHIVSHTFRA